MKIGRREFLGIAGALAVGSALAVYSKGEASQPVEQSSQIIEDGEDEKAQTPEKEERIEIILTGDVMLGRTVMTHSLDIAKDSTYPFHKVADTLKSADLVFVNLENPVVSNCKRIYTGFELCALPDMTEGLTYAGVDIVTLANNHTRIYGPQGVAETVNTLSERGILATGLGELVTKEVKGVKFGFLGFDFVTKKAAEEDYELVRQSKPKVDVLIAGVHWGSEYHEDPTEFQRKDAEKLVEAGADVIAGHHPHWVIEKEYINGKPVYYSLGNFIFDQMWSEETRRGLAIKLVFEGSKLIGEEELPIYMEFWAQPEFKLKVKSVDPLQSPMFGKKLLKL